MSHHPNEHRLTEYSAGSLAAGPALCIATHLERCSHCARRVEDLNLLGAALLDHSEESQCSADLFDKVMNGVSAQPKIEHSAKPALSRLIPKDLKSVAWKKLAGGVSTFDLPISEHGFIVKLMRVTAGRGVFEHTHDDSEFTVLLQGGYSDELGSYVAGDFIECDGTHTHKPVAHRDQDCIMLTAVSGNLKFTGSLTRMLNPFFSF